MKRPDDRIIAFAPAGSGGSDLVVAAGRAGALGFLDLTGMVGPGPEFDLRAFLASARRASGLTNHPFGIRISAAMASADWLAEAPSSLTVLACGEDSPEAMAGAFDAIHRSGRLAWAEVTSRESAGRAEGAGADGLVLSGHEAGGFVSDDSSFILLQAVAGRPGVPVYVRGGIGPRSASGCLAAGASGVVLDGALLLARESPLSDADRATLARLDGGEPRVFGPADGPRVRVFAPSGSPALEALRRAAEAGGPAWADAVREHVGWGPDRAWPIGQDAGLAPPLAREHATTAGIVAAVARGIDRGIADARASRPLAEGSPLARALGTRFPILQGPMTRVSDVAGFAGAVADGGALPFLALAMLRGAEASALLREASGTLAERPWGVGLLGFIDPDHRREQWAAVLAARPPFALIAGGRPDQAGELEAAGIGTFLHVPSPGLLDRFVREGARRFVLEGRECGGHVGPRSSLVLWEQAIAVLLEAIGRGVLASDLQVVFAGGVHDARSSALVAAMASPLAIRGVKSGVLVGTAYLFTAEAVATGAIVGRYQDEAIRCDRTVLLGTGPGHEVRVAPSPFALAFEAERSRLKAEGATAEATREALQGLNAGRLRVATKGVDRPGGAGSPLVAVAEADQFGRGTYMLGQVATLRDEVTTIEELHRSISVGGPALLEASESSEGPARPSDVAIVGMSAILPGAGDVRTFWENTLGKRDAITEIPADRWDWRLYYDADPKAPDKIVSKWGGFVPDVPFDPLRYGMPPASLPSIEPVQLLLLEATRAAIEDAGYADRPFDRERTAVVLGMGGGAAQLAMGYAFRSYLPMLDTVTPGAGRDALEACKGLLPEWTEDSFPGFLLNVAAGRVANRFDLGGANYTVDAACGSSLAAASLAVRELESGSADVVVLGGADTVQNPFTYLAFSKTQAFSPRGRCRPFDASADGIVISEGVAVLVLKRLADAERDGDRVYAVIKGLGASSDGRARGLTAPSPEGQVRAVERAYAKAGVDPGTVGYVEAHGTGTAVGDVVEVNAIAGVYRRHGVAPGSAAIGSVKSMIGHTKCAAGLAGLINATLALHHKVIPPTIGVEAINPRADLADGPFRVSTEARPWLHRGETPRRAAVSAFGFGGTNFHAVLEAHKGTHTPSSAPIREWPAELFAWRGDSRDGLVSSLDRIAGAIDAGARPAFRDLARAVNVNFKPSPTGPTLAIVATSLDDLRAKLRSARAAIASDRGRFEDPRGVFFDASPAFAGQPVAFLFPGQGSQAPGMLAELALAFPEVREAFESADAALGALGHRPVGPLAFPHPATDDGGRNRDLAALRATDAAQPALAAASLGLLRVLSAFGIEPGMVAGHSFGELTALHAAGCLSAPALVGLARERGRLMEESLGAEAGAMAAIAAGAEAVTRLIEETPGVVAVNDNGPGQTVVAGPAGGVARAVEAAKSAGLRAQVLPVAGAFHTPAVAGAVGPLAEAAGAAILGGPDRPAFSNLDAKAHPADPREIAARVGEHVAAPVKFAAMVGAMHDAGARVFVEAGPGSVLTPLVAGILGDRPHLAVACDQGGLPGFLRTLARLVVAGVPARLDRLADGRSDRVLDLARLPVGDGSPDPSPTTWLVNGTRARPIAQAESRRLGQGPALPMPPKAEAPSYRNGSANGNGHHSILPPGHPTRNGSKPMTPTANPTSPSPASVPAAPAASSSSDERVMAAFQETMRAFLDVQRTTMLAYLAGRPAAPALVPAPLAERITPRTAPAPGFSKAEPAPDGPEPTGLSSGRQEGPPLHQVPVVAQASPPAQPGSDSPRPAGPTGPAAPGREAVAARLVEIVRDRTGYPAEMLGLDLDLEADLGIDSIKRVEILGTLRDSVPALAGSADSSAMDALSRAKTLGAIVDRVEEIARRQMARAEPTPAARLNGEGEAMAALKSPVRRLTIEAVAAPLDRPPTGLVPGGVVLVTDDGRGVARALAGELEGAGHRVEVAGAADLSSAESVGRLLGRARGSGELAAIIHALPLREGPAAGLDPAAWAARIGPEVKGLFLLAKGAASDLERASARGGGALIAATAMGGSFGSVGAAGPDFFAGQGGVSGLVKTLAREWPGVRARVVDFDPRRDPRRIASRLAAEAMADDDWAEVGYQGDRRVRLAATPSALVDSGAGIELSPGEPVVVTGGARGITATLVLELARRWRPTLLLLGRSPLPPEAEDRETAGIASASELKAALHGRLRRGGGPVTPGDVERAYQATRQGREIRANLEAFRRAGAEVEYARVDVRDASALAPVLEGWRKRFGDPVGLVHGAGVIKDKLIRDKTPGMFDEVLGTKLDGALNLARLLDPGPILFAALFSSIAGRFGNAGQADYAAANEALNKLAIWLDGRWPGRVVSMNWGPWSGVGMVSELEGHLGGRGLGMIAPEAGRTLLLDELRLGRKGVVEVVVASDLGGLDGPARPANAPAPKARRAAGAAR